MEKKIVWSVYLDNANIHGPLPPVRVRCKDETEARREFAKYGTVAIGREEILEVKKPEELFPEKIDI